MTPAEAIRVYAASEAGRKVALHEADEAERMRAAGRTNERVAERRAHPRGRGRRTSDCAVEVVVREPSWRVVRSGDVVAESATMRCPYCPRRGRCQSCLGNGRILKNDGLHWPVAVARMEDSSVAREGQSAGQA